MLEPTKNIAIDLSEAVLDGLIDDELVKGIPVFGTIANLVKISGSISDRIFAAKLRRFLDESNHVSRSERDAFLERLAGNPKLQARTGQVIACSIEKTGDLEKASMIGTLTARLIAQELKFDDYRRMLHAIDATYLDDLKYFIAADHRLEHEGGGPVQELASVGLSEQVIRSFGEIPVNAPLTFNYTKTDLGIAFSAFLESYAEDAEPSDAPKSPVGREFES